MSSPGAPQPGWWQASDGNWYPPHLQPGGSPVPPPKPKRSGLVVALVIGVVLLLIAGLGIAAAVVVFSVENTRTDNAQRAACRVEAQTLIVANEARRSVAGTYATKQQLEDEQFLQVGGDRVGIEVLDGGDAVRLSPIGRCEGVFDAFEYRFDENATAELEQAFAS